MKRNYGYDANGNLTYIATGKQLNGDSTTLQATGLRKLLWDEENRLQAINDNGFVSNYWYDADGERAVKMSAGNEGVYVNGVQAAGKMSNAKFTAYISPYMVVNSGGWYSKHIYMGSQRIASKLGNSGMFTDRNPLTDTTAYKRNYSLKLESLTKGIKTRYDSLGVEYPGTLSTAGLVNSSPGNTTQSYFYHSDNLGSSSVITDQLGTLVQHVEYVPFGEVFVEERASASSWRTPYYLFNAKELDDETGLYYYGARYYDPRTSVWLGVDPLAEKYPNVGSYVYCINNPVKFVDPDGRGVFPTARELRNTGSSVVNDKRYNRNGSTTYCNFGSQAINGMSSDNSIKGRANEMGSYLRNTENATSLTQQQALDYANKGAVVFASYVSNGNEPGHIAVVAPTEKLTYSVSRNENVVNVFNVGATNGEMSLTQAFGKREVGLFILNSDIETINNQAITLV